MRVVTKKLGETGTKDAGGNRQDSSQSDECNAGGRAAAEGSFRLGAGEGEL